MRLGDRFSRRALRTFSRGIAVIGLGYSGLPTSAAIASRGVRVKGVDVNQQTTYGWTPLLTAVNNRNYRVGQLLIERGADVNAINYKTGESVLDVFER